MGYKKAKTRFTNIVRIDPKALNWLKENKDTRTVAGFLDKIINEYVRSHTEETLPRLQKTTASTVLADLQPRGVRGGAPATAQPYEQA
jgi:hypothetical protein